MRGCLRGFPILLKFVSSYQKEVTLDRRVLRDDQWERIAPLVPGKVEDAGRSGADNRLFVEAVLWIVRVGAPWRDLPEAFGNWNFGVPGAREQKTDIRRI
jgi:transposase